LYSVSFDARELWGESAEANQRVHIDLWESYLEPGE
jgi:nitrile hydratase